MSDADRPTGLGWPGTASPVPGLPATVEDQAAELARLLAELAAARRSATETYANAFLEAAGPVLERTERAKLAAADAVMRADLARAEVEVYRLLLAGAGGQG